jgi:hypothetical protein
VKKTKDDPLAVAIGLVKEHVAAKKHERDFCDEMRRWFSYNPTDPSRLRMTKRVRDAIYFYVAAEQLAFGASAKAEEEAINAKRTARTSTKLAPG